MSVQITKENFQALVLESDKTVLLDFYADWCGPCQMVAPILEEIAAQREDITVAKVNVDEQPELAGAAGVVSIPTLLVVKGGQVTAQQVGYAPKEKLLALLDE